MSEWKRPAPIPLRRDFFIASCLTVANRKVVVATFRGEADNSHERSHIYSAMEDALTRLLEEEQPSALILDLRELKYEWGDQMGQVLGEPATCFGGEFPVAVITSDLNREGLTSLVRDELLSEPAEWLAHSIEAAIALLRSKLPEAPAI